MAHLAYLPEKQQKHLFSQPFENEQVIIELQDEIDDLNRLIYLKDRALEEIKLVVCSSPKDTLGLYYSNSRNSHERAQLTAEDESTRGQEKFQSKDYYCELKQTVSNIFEQLETAVSGVSSEISSKHDKLKLFNTHKKKKSSKSSSHIEANDQHDTSMDTLRSKKVYQIPVEIQLLRDIVDIDIQVDFPTSDPIVFQVPKFISEALQSSQQKYTGLFYQNHQRIYEVPVEIIEVHEIPVEWTEAMKTEQELRGQNIVFEAPIGLISQKDQQRFSWRIQQLQDKIQALIQENDKIKQSKQIKRIYQVPLDIVEIEEVQTKQVDAINTGSSWSTTQHLQFSSQRLISDKHNPNIKETHLYTYHDIHTHKNDVESQTYQLYNYDNKIVKIPVVKAIEIPVIQERIIDRIIKIPFLQPIEIKEIRQVEAEDKEVQTQLANNWISLSNQSAQTEFNPQFEQRIAKIPFLKPIQISIQTQRLVKIPVVKTVQVTNQTDRIVKIPMIQPVQIPVETDRVVKIPIIKPIEIPVFTDKIVKIPVLKTVEVPVETDRIVKMPVLKAIEVPVYEEKVVQRIIQVQKIVEKIVEKPVEKIRLVEVPIQVEVIREVQVIREIPVEVQIEKIVQKIKLVEVPIEVEVIKEIEVIKEVQVVKEIQLIKQVEIVKQIQVVREVEKIIREVIVKEVPIEVVVEKIVPIREIQIREVPVQVVVERITLREVPIEVVIEKEVQIIKEVERLIEVPVIRQIPVQVVIETVKEVKKLVEVPVIVILEQEKGSEVVEVISCLEEESAAKMESYQLNDQPDYSGKQFAEASYSCLPPVKIFQIPIELELQNKEEIIRERIVEIQKIVEVDKYIEVQGEKIVEIPIIHEIHSIEYIPIEIIKEVKIPIVYELPIEVEVQRIVSSQRAVERVVQKIVEVERIVDRPVEVIVEREIIVEKIVEIPVQVFTEVQVEKVVYRDRLIEIPIELQMEPQEQQEQEVRDGKAEFEQVKQVPIYIPRVELVYVPICLEHSAFSSSSKKLISEQAIVHESQLSIKVEEQVKKLQSDEQLLLQGLNQGVQGLNQGDKSLDTLQVELDYNNSKFSNIKDIVFQFSQYNKFIQTDQQGVQADYQEDFIQNQIEQPQLIDAAVNTVNIPPKVQLIQIPIELQIEHNPEPYPEIEMNHYHHLIIIKQQYQTEIVQLHQLINHLQKIIEEHNLQSQDFNSFKQQFALQKQILEGKLAEFSVQQQEYIQLKQLLVNQSQNKLIAQEKAVILEKQFIVLQQQLAASLCKKLSAQEAECQTDYLNLFDGVNLIEVPIDIQIIQKIDSHYVQEEDLLLLADQQSQPQLLTHSSRVTRHLVIDKQFTYSVLVDSKLEEPTKAIIYEIPVEVIVTQEIQKQHQYNAVQFVEIPVEIHVTKDCNEIEVQTEILQQEQAEKQIYEVPVELFEYRDTVDVQVQTEAQQEEESRYTIKLTPDAEVVDILVESHQKEQKTKRLKLDSACNSDYWFQQKQRTSEREREDRSAEKEEKNAVQNKIIRLGSDITVNHLNNYSNVQSLTPGGLQNSTNSYDRFPPPPVNINVSVIKRRSSTQSDGKFFGSLDMRQELIGREDPIDSVRLAYKKLQGFQQASSEDEDTSKNNSREMIIQENDSVIEKEINGIQTPNLQHHDLNFSQYAKFQERLYTFQEEKPNYHQINYNLTSEIASLKESISEYERIIQRLKEQLEDEKANWQQQLIEAQDRVAEISKEKHKLQDAFQLQKLKIQMLEQEKKILSRQQQTLIDNCDRLKEQSLNSQRVIAREIQRYQIIITDKELQLRQAKAEEHHSKMIYQGHLQELREVILDREQTIDSLQAEIQSKNDKLDHLENSLEEMRKNIVLIKRNNEIDTAIIYEQEFERIKLDFQDQRKQMQFQAYELRCEVQKIKLMLADEESKVSQMNTIISELEEKLMLTQEENQQLHHLKSQIENQYIDNIKELQEMKEIVKEKQEKQTQLRTSLTVHDKGTQRVRIEYLSNHSSKISKEDRSYSQDYIKKLEAITMKYESMLVNSHGTIEQLQDKVCEYLKDALDKQQEAEHLYVKLVQLQNSLNNVLVEKVALEVENKRMLKSIQLSEKKLTLLGNRLIEVARKRAEYEQDDDDYYD